jgi:malate synthase
LVGVAGEVFESALRSKPNQKERLREDVQVSAAELIDFQIPGGTITEAGLRTNINIGIQYIESWLRGVGAAALYNLMEDTATAEISRAQVWQWLHSSSTKLEDGGDISMQMVKRLISEEMEKIKEQWGEDLFASGKFARAREIFEDLVTNGNFAPFLTLVAYPYLD